MPSGSATCRSAMNKRRRRARGAGRPCRGARRPTSRSTTIIERAGGVGPGQRGWQRDLSVSQDKLGDVRRRRATLRGRSRPTRRPMPSRERLAASRPGQRGWQRDLSVSWNKLGDVRQAQGDLAGALAAYEAGHAIGERLAASDPGNAGWQRDLSVSWNKLGDVRQAQGDLAGGARGLRGGPRHRRASGGVGPGQCGVAARPDRVQREACRDEGGRSGDAGRARAAHYRQALAVARELAGVGRGLAPPGRLDRWRDLERRLAGGGG